MTKIEELRAHFEGNVIERGNKLVGKCWILLDEENRMFYTGKSGFNKQRRSLSWNNLPSAVTGYLNRCGKSIVDKSHCLILSVEVSSDQVSSLLPEFQPFKEARPVRRAGFRESQEMTSFVYSITHPETGVQMFASLLTTDQTTRLYGASRSTVLAMQILKKRISHLSPNEQELFRAVPLSGSIKIWDSEIIREVDATNTRALVKLLNDSAMTNNIRILREMQANQTTTQ